MDHFLNKLGVKNMGALSRAVAKSLRPSVVWIASLLIFSFAPVLGGEKFEQPRSWVLFIALLLQLLGILLYSEVLKARWVEPQEEDKHSDDEDEDPLDSHPIAVSTQKQSEKRRTGRAEPAEGTRKASREVVPSMTRTGDDMHDAEELHDTAVPVHDTTDAAGSKATPVKAVAFDFGGVLFTEGKRMACERLTELGYDWNEIMKILVSPESFACRRGEIHEQSFWSWAQNMLPEDYDVQVVRSEWNAAYQLDFNMVDVISAVRNRGFSTFAFTDGMPSRVENLDRRYAFRAMKLFDEEIQSYDLGYDKQAKVFVDKLLTTAGCQSSPESLLLIDDTPSDAAVARSMGVSVIDYEHGNTAKLVQELVSRGVLDAMSSRHIGDVVPRLHSHRAPSHRQGNPVAAEAARHH
eukprot:CAMPEP_0175832532 /NCGR_PEP_ID=MMETSP0107_2-20121207/15036_1 /TAXON_ID=195067 ORGANISM="Goniomonas pacifica, Strain CCMP1869" /NCGR_SAMPLE_ID=MMETSP0107_2 /ASSEMBLY_ACC=CAM_ASM_000203 /LENGTH=407 /DNA_ID=CAMNT_0017145619 /DNA_START=700 /DNA_END=1923 /DNA_ORIENTATION=-